MRELQEVRWPHFFVSMIKIVISIKSNATTGTPPKPAELKTQTQPAREPD